MLLDILIFTPLLLYILLGVRDGTVRKLIAIVVLIGGLIAGQIYMRDVGAMIVGRGGIDSEDAPIYGFLIIFFGLFILQSLLYKIITKNYKIGGIPDRVGGTVLGFIEGAIFVSSLLFIFAMAGFPDRQTKHDSSFYKSFVNIAPQILDLTSTVGPDVLEKFKEIGTPGSGEGNKVKKDAARPGKTSTGQSKK
jgi:uncharacterized membrane protein required for colicin V production